MGDDIQLAEEYHRLKAVVDEAKESLEAHKKLMIAKADGKKRILGDVQCYPVKKKGSVQYSKAIKELLPDADLEKYRGKESTSWTFK